MFKLLILIHWFIVGLHLVSPQIPPNAALPSGQGLAHLLFTSSIMALNPQASVACFTDYLTHLNIAGETYSRDYNVCLVQTKKERKQIDSEALLERRQLIEASEAVCKNLRTCNVKNSSMEVFHCHSKIGAENTKSTYSISGNASEYATRLHERYRLVDLHHQQCCHKAERKYVTNTADNYSHLQACLEGRVKPRPPLLTTTTTMTTSTPAVEPQSNTSTANSTTNESSTTATKPTSSMKPSTTDALPELPPNTTPSSSPAVVAEEVKTTTEPNQGIQTQIGQFLNLLN